METREQPKLDLAEIIQEAFDLYKAHFGILLGANLIAMLLSLFTAGLLAGPMMAGLAMVTLALIDRREPTPEIGEVFKGFDVFLPSFLYGIVIAAVSMVISLLVGPFSIIATWVISSLTLFSIFFIVERKLDFWPAITASYDVVKNNFFVYFGITIVAGILSQLGLIACCIGVIVTAPMYICMLTVTYRKVFPAPGAADEPRVEEPVVEPPPPGPATGG